MLDAMEIQKGFQKTEIGVIPSDWEVKKLSSVCSLSKTRINPINSEINYKCVELEHLSQETGRLLGSANSKNLKSQKTVFNKGDVLFGKLRPYLKKFLYANFDGVCTTEIWVLKSSNGIQNKWLYYLVQTDSVLEVANQTEGTKMPRADWKMVSETKIPLPPTKAEQTAIANALNDADALITQLEKLIAKKRNIKQGAMQELLKGKRRLPGFEEKKGYKQTDVGVIPNDWEIKSLAEITSLMTNGFVGTVKSHYTDYDNGILYIQGYNVEENSFNFTGIKRVSHEFHKQHFKSCLQEGDLLTIQTGDIGITTVVSKELEGSNCHALIITRFKKRTAEPKFYSYYFNFSDGRKRLKEIETGSTMKHINVGDMTQMLIPYPPKAEQIRIAQILSDMDAEIEALEKKLDKYKMIKQGMMQNLLTGKKRLI